MPAYEYKALDPRGKQKQGVASGRAPGGTPATLAKMA